MIRAMALARKKATPRRAVRTKLATYRAKRSFDVTAEPSGDAPAQPSTGWSYVIQKHAARRLHYDFRLELDGVLLSWSVPKGPSLVPGSRRLAVRTEDHPLDYRDFEGIIPKGQYGGGTVVVWDRGTWTPDGDAHDMMKRGRLTFTIDGAKLHGRWHLVRTKMTGSKAENWLLFKGRDDDAVDKGPEIVDARPDSVITGRTIDQVAEDADAVWESNRATPKTPTKPKPAAAGDLASLVSALPTDLPFTNLDKVLWPEAGITKAQLLAYTAVTAEWSLPHVADRPLTLVRCPNGHTAQCWFQKHAGKGTPASIRRVAIREAGNDDALAMYIDDLRGLLAVAQLGALELHTWGSHVKDVERPDLIVFDLDPDPALPWARVVEGAHELRTRLAALDLESWVKTTGGKGLHVCVPITPRAGWDDVKAFSRAIAEATVAAAPARYTINAAQARRTGKTYLDYLRNGRGATFIAPYSPRRRPGAPVATPITWDELDAGILPSTLTMLTIPARLGALPADPWKGLRTARQTITAAARRAVGLR